MASNAQGWKLSAQLVNGQLGALGMKLAGALAKYDPATATQVDRDNLQDSLNEAAMTLAAKRAAMRREQKEADDLRARIELDAKTAEVLIEQGASEAAINKFLDALEAAKARLPKEEQDVVDAKAIVDSLNETVNILQQRLDDHDRQAAEIERKMALAKADAEREALRLKNQQELAAIRDGIGQSSTALSLLAKQAEEMAVKAEGTKILADMGQGTVDDQKAIAEARKLAEGMLAGKPTGESAKERLARITGKVAEAA